MTATRHEIQRRRVTRREALFLIGGAMLASQVHGQDGMARPAGCILTPQQTEGPYFVDERLRRADIRTHPSDGSVTAGIPLRLSLRILSADAACAPVAGAIVDLWHCDADGRYSDTTDSGFDTSGRKFLRGYQVSADDGKVQFLTIYPGWYRGRTVHIHFKVRARTASGREHEFTSQLYFDDAVTDTAHAHAPYAGRRVRRTRNEEDGIFRRGGAQLLLTPVASANGYAASFDVGIAAA